MAREVTITYYGLLAEKLEIQSEQMQLPSNDLEIKSYLTKLHPELSNLTFSVAVDLEYRDKIELKDNPKKIDVMPPFAGG